MPTPTATPPPASENKKFSPSAKTQQTPPVFKADIDEGESPRTLATEPTGTPKEEEALPEPALNGVAKQEEDADTDREGDIYAQKVLACKSLLCSGIVEDDLTTTR